MAQDDKTRANALIDKYDGNFSSLDVNGLCNELSTIVMQWAYTVFEVFNVMSERGYSQAALEDVATNLTNRINDANLIELAKSMHGATLLARIQYLMNCQANLGQGICQRISTAFQRANDILREQDKKKPNDTGQPRQLTEEEVAFFVERGQNQKLWMKKGKLIDRKLFDPSICWDLPESGTGFTTYKIDDLKRPKLGDAKYGYDQIGTKETVEAMIRIAEKWYSLHADRKMQYGDMSRPGGINTPDHSGHKDGKTFDIRPLRNDARLEALTLDSKGNHPNYDRDLTKECMRLVFTSYSVKLIYFNDPHILSDPNFNKIVTRSDKTHYNHFHVELR